MKKRVCWLLCITIILVTALTGCAAKNTNSSPVKPSTKDDAFDKETSSQKQSIVLTDVAYDGAYRVLVYDHSDSDTSVDHTVEYEFADKEKYQGKNAPEKLEIKIGDTNYIGHFQSTQYREYNCYPSYTYTDADGNSFEVDDQGMLTAFFGQSSTGTEKALTKDACVKIAKDFLSDKVDIGAYDVQVEDDRERGFYTVTVTKMINGIKTADTASVVVWYTGEIYRYASFMFGRIDGTDVETVDLKELDTAVQSKLYRTYQSVMKTYSRIEYEKKEVLLTVLKEGTTGFLYTVDVKCIKDHGEFSAIVSERISFVVEIG